MKPLCLLQYSKRQIKMDPGSASIAGGGGLIWMQVASAHRRVIVKPSNTSAAPRTRLPGSAIPPPAGNVCGNRKMNAANPSSCLLVIRRP